MNSINDFKKKPSGVIVNTNSQDYMRAKNRNYINRQQRKMLGTFEKEGELVKFIKTQQYDHKEISAIKKDIKEIKHMLSEIIGEHKCQ